MTNSPAPDIHICPLPQYGLLSITSADNLKFLQGQFTCDLREVTAKQWRYGALCTNKGRMISNFLLVEAAQNHHLLRLQRSTLGAVHDTLKKFAPFYKGALEDVTDHHTLVGLSGSGSAAFIKQRFGDLPGLDGSVCQHKSGFVIRLSETRYECWLKSIDGVLDTNSAASHWDLLNIQAGLGEVSASTIEEWTPHMLNLQATGAVNFKKGCYTGQEIVARTEYRGQQKRAMYRIGGTGPAPAPATRLFDHEHEAGEIVLSSPINTDWEALAVINENHLDKPLTCGGKPVSILTLPYAFKKHA